MELEKLLPGNVMKNMAPSCEARCHIIIFIECKGKNFLYFETDMKSAETIF